MSDIYCGVKSVPKNKKLGTMKQCTEKKQVRYFGIKKVDMRLLKASKTNVSDTKQRQNLKKKELLLRGKLRTLKSRLQASKNLEEKEKLREEIKLMEEKIEMALHEFSKFDKIKKIDNAIHEIAKKEPELLENIINQGKGLRYKRHKQCLSCMSGSCLSCGGVNPQLIAEAVKAIPAVAESITKGVETGVKTQHEFNKDNLALAAEKSRNFNTFYRDLVHRRYHDPESLPPRLRLKRFNIDPVSAIFDKKNEANRDRADDALYEYAEQQIEKMQSSIKGKGLRHRNLILY
jgi:hypothetical protein